MIQNAAAWLAFNEPKRAYVTPLFVSLHWLPVAARIQFKTLMLEYKTTTGSAPTYFHSLLQIYIPSRSLRSAITERLKITLQNILVHHSWLVEWSSHPHPECWLHVNLQATTENSSLSTLLDFIIIKKLPFSISSSFSLPFSPSLASLYLFEQCLRLGVRGTSSVCLPFQDESLYVFPNCKSLWIKASAKWLNVNVKFKAHKGPQKKKHISQNSHKFIFDRWSG